MNTPHRIDELIVDLSFQRDTGADVPVDEDLLRGLVIDKLLPALDQVLSQHADGGGVWQIDTLEIDLGDIPEEELDSELPLRLQDRVRSALADLLRGSPQSAAGTGLRTIPRATADADFLKRYLRDGGIVSRVAPDALAPHEAALDRLLEGATSELLSLLRHAPMRPVFARRLAQQFPQRQLHALLRTLVPVSDADQLLQLIERFEQMLVRSEGDGAAHRNMLRVLWQHVLELALRDGTAVPELAAFASSMQTPIPPSLRSAAAQLRPAAETPVAGLAAQLLNRLALGATTAPVVAAEEAVVTPRPEMLALAEDEATVHKLTQALLQADAGLSAQWRHLLSTRPALWREALSRIGANADAWRRIAAVFPASLLDEIAALQDPDTSAAAADRSINASVMPADRLHEARMAIAQAAARDDHAAANGNLSTVPATSRTVIPVAVPGDDSYRPPGPVPATGAAIEQSDSDVAAALDLPSQQQAAWLKQWLVQVRAGERRVNAHRWTVDRLQRLINAVAALESAGIAGRHAPMLQSIALQAPRARDQQRYFALVLEQLVRGVLLDLDKIVAQCNTSGEHRAMSTMQERTGSTADTPPGIAATVNAGPADRVGTLRIAIIEALTKGDTALLALYRTKVRSRHTAQATGLSGNADDLYQLIAALANEHAGAGRTDRSMLLRAIVTHAQCSIDAERYLRYVLEDLAHERDIDFDAIDARATLDPLPAPVEPKDEPALGRTGMAALPPTDSSRLKIEPAHAADEIRERVAQALSSANAASLYPEWERLLRTHAPVLRQALHQIGARIGVWRKVAATFPASLLDEMTALLAPEAASALRSLITRDAFFESAGGAARHGDLQQWEQQLWSASFMHLLDLQRPQFNARDYVMALLSAMAGSDQVRYRRLALEWKQELLADPAAGMRLAALVNALSVFADKTPVQAVVSTSGAETSPEAQDHDSYRPSGPVSATGAAVDQSDSDVAAALDLPPQQQAAWLKQWLVQVRAGERSAAANRLTVEQLQRLINAVAALESAGIAGRHTSMLQSIALQAPRARDQQRYFALVLEQLVHGALLDLDEIVAQCNASGEDRDTSAAHETAVNPADQSGRSGAAILSAFDTSRFEAGQIHSDDATSIRKRVLQALSSANAASLYPDWERLLRTHAPALRQALHQIGAQIDVWQRIAETFPASLLDELTALLAPEAASALRPLMVRPAWLKAVHAAAGPDAHSDSVQQLWVASFMHLLRMKTAAFDAGHYTNVLLDRMAGQAAAQRRTMASAWLDAISAQASAADESSDAVARALSERLALPEPSASVSVAATNRSTDASVKSADGLHEMKKAIANAVAHEDHAALKSLLQSLPPAGPALELPGMNGDAVILHWLINSFVAAAAGGADRSTLLQAIASHVARSRNQTRYLLHVLADLVHDRVIDLDAIDELCVEPTNESVRPETVQAAAGPAPERALQVGQSAGPQSFAAPARHGFWLAQALAAHPPAVRAALSPMLHEAGTASSVDQLPRTLLRKLVTLLAGADERATQRHAWDIADIFAQCHPGVSGERIDELKWQFLFAWLFEQRRRFEPSRFSHALADYLTSRTGIAPTSDMRDLMRRRLGIEPLAPDELPELLNAAAPYLMPETVIDEAEQIYVGNAGQVLAAPYMPRLFAMLNLTEGGRFKNGEAAERAVHLLQFMTSGQSDCPEYQLGLNKILCGVKASQPIVREIEIEAHEKDVVEALIKAMIEHWKVIGNTSIDGLRESFLQRPGSLHMKDDAWYLTVQAGAFDMLLDRLPWSFSIIKHPWMERAVHVTWR
ncbi:MAG: hypothetical protein A3I66_04265 [Burkholderiales bacterium RIFCSPLOWO2_02_FULL_57_36]|nr:MAG: hypothetical protein A3I66_04265 [Burkholderiales bacterium RIFCSPLOWO2_02_FULL_57_36]